MPKDRPDWASFRLDVTTVALDGILLHVRWLLTPKGPLEVTVVVVSRKGSPVDPICKENRKKSEDKSSSIALMKSIDENGVLKRNCKLDLLMQVGLEEEAKGGGR
ncbi:hypothetical protein CRG98_029081 [Punica granatum]|uniref:Uncharacterized protein n=1 Tax=Punica granatum TaxID=22663 RepID=A0A2I0J2T0_PUNGR|nr:hypothetical protein CRG98_029081 [Punica granatum]